MEPNLSKYKAFVTAVECGSLSEAARLLNYSQSGISRMIADLEKECGLPLLKRSRQGVSLTEFGQELLPLIKTLCLDFERLKMKIAHVNGTHSGIIRIGTIASVETCWLPGIIAEFEKKYPLTKFELLLGEYEEIEEFLLEQRVELGFLRLPVRGSLETLALEKDELMVLLPDTHPLAAEKAFPVQALSGEPFIMPQKDVQSEITELFRKNHLPLHPKYTSMDDLAALSMVEKGLGITILPKLFLKRLPFAVTARSLDPPEYRTIGIAMNDHRLLSAAARRFLDYLNYREN